MPPSTLSRPFLRSVASIVGLLLVLLVGPPALQAQSGSAESVARLDNEGPWVPSLRTMGQDALDIARAPVELTRSQQFLALGASGIVVGAVSALDRPAYEHLNQHSGWASEVSGPLAGPGRWYDRAGPDRVALGTAGLLAASGVALQRRDLTRTSAHVLEAVVYTKLVTGFAKGLMGRSRPFVGAGPFEADPGEFEGVHTETSMPSGHTARAFAIASVLAHEADRWYVSALAYSGASSVGLERVRSGDHWLTDVIVGGALGYFIGRSVVPSERSSDRVTYTPLLSPDRVGLSFQF